VEIVSGGDIYEKFLDASVVTIGNFDGVHRGHAAIFAQLNQQSIHRSIPSAVVTFEPHPLKILAPETAPPLITTFAQKAALIEKCGVDFLVVVPFSKEFSRLSAGDFVHKILCTPLGMRHIIIGHDYAFGRGREGNYTTLQRFGGENGFTVEDLPPIGDEGIVFSSSLVRAAIADGDMMTASQILGRFYQISGTVVHGRDVGHALGFPTANISTANELFPPDGVYAVIVHVEGKTVKGACNIGCNPTFDGDNRTVEVFLLDYSARIYDHEIAVQFVQKLRSEQKFPDISALKAAIGEDVAVTRIILEKLDITYSGSASSAQ
jgi:riboflavin kinase/FMN adenylyltransferase